MNTEELITQSRGRFDHASAKRVLKEKYQAKLTFAYNGGLWLAGPELHSAIVTSGSDDTIVLLDLYENPIKVNTKELLAQSQQRWQEQLNGWLVEYNELTKTR